MFVCRDCGEVYPTCGSNGLTFIYILFFLPTFNISNVITFQEKIQLKFDFKANNNISDNRLFSGFRQEATWPTVWPSWPMQPTSWQTLAVWWWACSPCGSPPDRPPKPWTLVGTDQVRTRDRIPLSGWMEWGRWMDMWRDGWMNNLLEGWFKLH